MRKLTLITIADGKNIEATKESVAGFMKYNGPVIIVNNTHSDEINKIGYDMGATVYNPTKKYDYPSYTKDQIDDLIDFTYSSIFRPAMMVDTEYFMVGEPDCLFLKPINNSVFSTNKDIIVPSDQTPMKLNWAFTSFYDGFGVSSEEKNWRFNGMLVEFWKYCVHVGINFQAAADNDMRFVFTANSIIRTEKIRELYLKERYRITLLARKLVELVEKMRPKDDIVNEHLSKLTTHFGPDQIFSIILGLYLFTWDVNPNGLHCRSSMFGDETSLNNYITDNPHIEYIHSCKLHYNT